MRIRTHSPFCWQWHFECAVAKLTQLLPNEEDGCKCLRSKSVTCEMHARKYRRFIHDHIDAKRKEQNEHKPEL